MPYFRVGRLSAWAIATIGALYAVALAVGIAAHGFREPIADPTLAIMECLTILSACAIVVLVVAIHAHVPAPRAVHAAVSLAFTVMFAGTTCVVHVVQLTALRQLGHDVIVWPSVLYAAELAAWDLFLGLALLFAAPVFAGTGDGARVRRGLILCGVLCLAGLVGPALGDMRLQLVGVFGYAVVLPVTSVCLAAYFRRAERARAVR